MKEIINLLQFEPTYAKEKQEELEIFTKYFKYNNLSLQEILVLEKIEEFPIFSLAINILKNLEDCLTSFNDKNNSSMKRVRGFKSSKTYLDNYINSFETTLEVLKNVDSSDTLNKELLQTTINIFKKVKDDRSSAFSWLIAEYIFYNILKDNKVYQSDLLPFSQSIPNADLNKFLDKSQYYSNLFEKYFMGLDLIENDFYKSTYIKLVTLYNKEGVNIGYRNKNPKTHILDILTSMGCNIDLTSISTKNFYIKNFYNDIAIFSSNTSNSSLEDITSHHLTNLSQIFPKDYLNDYKEMLTTQLLFDL